MKTTLVHIPSASNCLIRGPFDPLTPSPPLLNLASDNKEMIKEVENNTISSAHSRSQSSTSRFRDYLILEDDDDDCRWPACPYPCPHLHIKALTRPGEAYIAPGICLPGHILHQQAYAYIAMPAYTRFLGAYTAVFMGSATRYKVSLF